MTSPLSPEAVEEAKARVRTTFLGAMFDRRVSFREAFAGLPRFAKQAGEAP